MSKITIISLMFKTISGRLSCLLSYQYWCLSSSTTVINQHLKIGYSLILIFKSLKINTAFPVFYWKTIYIWSYMSVEVSPRIIYALVEILPGFCACFIYMLNLVPEETNLDFTQSPNNLLQSSIYKILVHYT